MRCLSVTEAADLLGGLGFSILSQSGRNSLRLRSGIVSAQARTQGSPPIACWLSDFAAALIRWHTNDGARLLWIDHWGDLIQSAQAFVMAARVGLGETRSLSEAPGHYFDPHPYNKRYPPDVSAAHAQELSVMIGFIVAMIVNQWDGWLIDTNSTERIEFWEGNVLFYSADKKHLAASQSILDGFGCDPKMQ